MTLRMQEAPDAGPAQGRAASEAASLISVPVAGGMQHDALAGQAQWIRKAAAMTTEVLVCRTRACGTDALCRTDWTTLPAHPPLTAPGGLKARDVERYAQEHPEHVKVCGACRASATFCARAGCRCARELLLPWLRLIAGRAARQCPFPDGGPVERQDLEAMAVVHGLKLVLLDERLAPEATLSDPRDPSAFLYRAMYRRCLTAVKKARRVRQVEVLEDEGNEESDGDDWLARAIAARRPVPDDPDEVAFVNDILRRLPGAVKALREELVEQRDALGAPVQAVASARIRLAVFDVWPPAGPGDPTQQELAEQIGCAQASIARAKAHIVKRLKALLGLDPADDQE